MRRNEIPLVFFSLAKSIQVLHLKHTHTKKRAIKGKHHCGVALLPPNGTTVSVQPELLYSLREM